jgi:hypothetical protein
MRLIWQPAAMAALLLASVLPSAGPFTVTRTPATDVRVVPCGYTATPVDASWNNCTGSGELISVDRYGQIDYAQCVPVGEFTVGSARTVNMLRRLGTC